MPEMLASVDISNFEDSQRGSSGNSQHTLFTFQKHVCIIRCICIDICIDYMNLYEWIFWTHTQEKYMEHMWHHFLHP